MSRENQKVTTQKESQNAGGWLKNRDVGENEVGGKGKGKGNKLKKQKTRNEGNTSEGKD